MRHWGLVPERLLIPELERYPAQLHIDLLPEYQRQGFGRRLTERLVEAFERAGGAGPAPVVGRHEHRGARFLRSPGLSRAGV